MKVLIINDTPYGTEKEYNALRLASQILRDNENIQVTVFLRVDAVSCAEARELEQLKFIDGAELSTLKELAQLTIESDKVFSF